MGKLTNLFRLMLSYNYKMTKVLNHPIVWGIETTNKCNLACIMCPHPTMSRKKGEMDIGLFQKVVGEMKGYNSRVVLANYGEPFLDSRIYDRIEYCHVNGIRTEITTNATVLFPKVAHKLLSIANPHYMHLIIGIDGFTEKTYESVRLRGKYETTKNNVEQFLELRKQQAGTVPKVSIQIIEMEKTETEIEAFVGFWQGRADEVIIKKLDVTREPRGVELSELHHRYYQDVKRTRPPCLYLWYGPVILWDGKAVPCCIDAEGKLILGDLREQKLSEIWNGTRLQELRRQHIAGEFHNGLCESCTDYPDYSPTRMFLGKQYLNRIYQEAKAKLPLLSKGVSRLGAK